METLAQDIRYALRSLARARGFTLLAVLCLGAGIGVNTAIFSVAHAILFRALPFDDPDAIVGIEANNAVRGIDEGGLTFADLRALQEATGAFEAIEGQQRRNFTLSAGDGVERVEGAAITPGLFPMLGAHPALGRNFRADDGAPAGFEQVVLLSDALWRNRYAADPAIVGRPIRINQRELTVVGVMPPGFAFPDRERLWVPLGSANAEDRSARYIFGIARLRPGIDVRQADERAAEAAARFAQLYPETHENWELSVRSYRDATVDHAAQRLMVLLLGAVAFVLLIACANVANLMLARAADRSREMAVRTAMGAGRSRIVRQLLTESVLLALAGAVVGVVIAAWMLRVNMASIPEEPTYWMRIGIHPDVLLYTVLVAVATGLLFGAAPAWHVARSDLFGDLRNGMRAGESRATARLRSSLVVGEIALSMVLVIGALLFMRSFLNVQRESIGVQVESLYSLRTMLAGDRYDEVPARLQFYTTAADRLGELPGAAGAAVVSAIPADDGGWHLGVEHGDRTDRDALVVSTTASTDGFFAIAGAPLLAGRDFTRAEVVDTAAAVAIVGESLARRLWPDGSALGRSLRVVEHGRSYTIVGIAPDLFYEELGEATPQSTLQLHLPLGRFGWRGMSFLVRADGSPAELAVPVRDGLRAIDPDIAPYEMMTMRERRHFTSWNYRLFGQLFGTFGALAFVLALCGVYGVMVYSVARRRREIGVRVALGAAPTDVRGLVLRRAALIAGIGIAIGTLAALAITRFGQSVLYGVSSNDPLTFLLVPALIAATALLASWLPARRAAAVDPMIVLRSE